MAATPDDAGYWCSRPTVGSSPSGMPSSMAPPGHAPQRAHCRHDPHARRGRILARASDGGIFSFGDAAFYGSTGSLHLDKPIVGLAPTIDGHGYWLVASEVGFRVRRCGLLRLHRRSAPAGADRRHDLGPRGSGYWLVASNGGIFSFGTWATSAQPEGCRSMLRWWAWIARPTARGTGWSDVTEGSTSSRLLRFRRRVALERPIVGMVAIHRCRPDSPQTGLVDAAHAHHRSECLSVRSRIPASPVAPTRE